MVETRKAEKIKIFKKIRRQGYRRTKGHRQHETVLRVTGITGAGLDEKWDGVVDMTTKAMINARARNLPHVIAELEAAAGPVVAKAPAKAKAAPKAKVEAVEAAAPEAKAAPKKAAVPKKAPAKKPDAE